MAIEELAHVGSASKRKRHKAIEGTWVAVLWVLRTFIKYKGVLAEVKVIVVNLAYPISVSGDFRFRPAAIASSK